jgi:small subunit ribosomal protein S20
MVDSPTVPRSKTVLKRQRQNVGRHLRNKAERSELRTRERKVRSATGPDAPTTALKSLQSALDKAAAKGAIHPNKAARKKSRLTKAVAKKSG